MLISQEAGESASCGIAFFDRVDLSRFGIAKLLVKVDGVIGAQINPFEMGETIVFINNSPILVSGSEMLDVWVRVE